MAKAAVLIHTQSMVRFPSPEILSALGVLVALVPLLAPPRRYRMARDWLCDGYRTRPGSRPETR